MSSTAYHAVCLPGARRFPRTQSSSVVCRNIRLELGADLCQRTALLLRVCNHCAGNTAGRGQRPGSAFQQLETACPQALHTTARHGMLRRRQRYAPARRTFIAMHQPHAHAQVHIIAGLEPEGRRVRQNHVGVGPTCTRDRRAPTARLASNTHPATASMPNECTLTSAFSAANASEGIARAWPLPMVVLARVGIHPDPQTTQTCTSCIHVDAMCCGGSRVLL
jgi:hypothetical protein